MFPEICRLGPVTVYSYGLMLAVAVLVCAVLLSRDAGAKHIKAEIIFDYVFWVVLSGIVGARAFFIFLNADFYANNPLEIILIQKGGLAWQGGFLAGTGTALWYGLKKKLPLLTMVDLTAPYIALGHAIGRIGCFLNGCCYGREVHWGFYFPVHEARQHPTQLYAVGGLLLIFFILKKFQSVSKIQGQVFVLYLILASLQRFINEFFRGDSLLTYAGLTIFQIVSLVIFVTGIILHVFMKRSRKS